MNGRGTRYDRDYGWREAQRDLEDGIHPEVVAARIGEPVEFLREVAEQQGWPVTHSDPAKRWPLTELDA